MSESVLWTLVVMHESDNYDYRYPPTMTLFPDYASAIKALRDDFAEELWNDDTDDVSDDGVIERLRSQGTHAYIDQLDPASLKVAREVLT